MLRVCDLPQHYVQQGLRGWDPEKRVSVFLEITHTEVSHQSRPYTFVKWGGLTPTICYWTRCEVPVDLDSLREFFMRRYSR